MQAPGEHHLYVFYYGLLGGTAIAIGNCHRQLGRSVGFRGSIP